MYSKHHKCKKIQQKRSIIIRRW